MLTPTYQLTTKPSEECPRADHILFYYKTCHYFPHVGTHDFKSMSLLCPPLPGKPIKLFFFTSPKTLSLRQRSRESGVRNSVSKLNQNKATDAFTE